MSTFRRKFTTIATLLLAFYAISGSFSPLAAQDGKHEGVFGTVTDITLSDTGLTTIGLKTEQGRSVILASFETSVSISDRETAELSDISPGDFLAILGSKVADNLEAENILVKPSHPVTTSHITGIIVESTSNHLVIVDADGNRIAADPAFDIKPNQIGTVVTAVVRQDLRSGSLAVLAIQSDTQSILRLETALANAQKANATQNISALKARLQQSTTSNLTALQNILFVADKATQTAVNQHLATFKEVAQTALARFGLGSANVHLLGVVEVVDSQQRIAVITPEDGDQVEILITDDTRILLQGDTVTMDRLLLGHRVRATYDPDTSEGSIIEIFSGETLSPKQERILLPIATAGEAEGSAAAVFATTNPQRLALLTEDGTIISLTVDSTTDIEVRGEKGTLQDIALNARIKVQYAPSKSTISQQAIRIETFDLVPGENFIHGIVNGYNRKTGHVAILQSDSQSIGLTITDNTNLKKDGLKVTISEVQLGDIVRPITRYSTTTKELSKFGLKSPPDLPIVGIIRGKDRKANTDSITISTNDLKLVSLVVTDNARIERQGNVVAFSALEVGERIVAGLYDPVTLQASQLIVQPGQTLQIRGIITAVNADVEVITITPDQGTPVTLIVSKRSVISKHGTTGATFDDLSIGDQVRLAFYRSGSKELVRVVIP